ncbi:MAG: hypothetical protein K2X03_26370 [Bryobacteraceae bacterium]|nr:hypothetical protein [Bryobacteraceae bacterium]
MNVRFGLGLFLLILATRLAHWRVLWVEEAYPMSGALAVLGGLAPYRDFWYDKPPLALLLYLLCGAQDGWPLRLLGAVFIFGCAHAAYAAARARWTAREGHYAAALTAFFLTFGLPAAVMAVAPDLLLLLPHLMAIAFAWGGRPFAAGVAAGVAMWVHAKGVFVLAAAALFLPFAAWPWMLAGFALPVLALALTLAGFGAIEAYWRQVWQWGALYSNDTFLASPWTEGLRRTANWLGFAAALVVGALFAIRREGWRFAAWAGLMLASVALGLRFFPRYYFALVPPLALLAARGITQGRAWCILPLLLIPLVRFGPGYVRMAAGQPSPDLALFEDVRRASREIRPGESLFVWGYRPELLVLTRAPLGTPYLESQPLTGVFADRHLFTARPSATAERAMHLARLAASRPEWVADGLGPLNPALAIEHQPALREWLGHYREVSRRPSLVLYRRVVPR